MFRSLLGWRGAVLAVTAVTGLAMLVAPWRPAPRSATSNAISRAPLSLPAPGGLLVEVIGAVAAPGIFHIDRGQRVYEVVELAGGLLPEADLARLPNLAARVHDGQQVKVPFAGASSRRPLRHSLNQAPAAELLTVPGLDAAIVDAILEYRSSFGGFSAVSELTSVLGLDALDYALAHPHLSL